MGGDNGPTKCYILTSKNPTASGIGYILLSCGQRGLTNLPNKPSKAITNATCYPTQPGQ